MMVIAQVMALLLAASPPQGRPWGIRGGEILVLEDRVEFKTRIVEIEEIATQDLSAETRETVSFGAPGARGVPVRSHLDSFAMTLNGSPVEPEWLDFENETERLFRTDGWLLQSSHPQDYPGDARSLDLVLPEGRLKERVWEQDFILRHRGRESTDIPIRGRFRVARLDTIGDRRVLVVEGELDPQVETGSGAVFQGKGKGKAQILVDAATGVALGKSLSFKIAYLRTDAISRYHKEVAGELLGITVEFQRSMRGRFR